MQTTRLGWRLVRGDKKIVDTSPISFEMFKAQNKNLHVSLVPEKEFNFQVYIDVDQLRLKNGSRMVAEFVRAFNAFLNKNTDIKAYKFVYDPKKPYVLTLAVSHEQPIRQTQIRHSRSRSRDKNTNSSTQRSTTNKSRRTNQRTSRRTNQRMTRRGKVTTQLGFLDRLRKNMNMDFL